MEMGLFAELKGRYPDDLKDVSQEMAGRTFLVIPAATPQKRKDGKEAKFLQPLLKFKILILVNHNDMHLLILFQVILIAGITWSQQELDSDENNNTINTKDSLEKPTDNKKQAKDSLEKPTATKTVSNETSTTEATNNNKKNTKDSLEKPTDNKKQAKDSLEKPTENKKQAKGFLEKPTDVPKIAYKVISTEVKDPSYFDIDKIIPTEPPRELIFHGFKNISSTEEPPDQLKKTVLMTYLINHIPLS
ncbi:Hypothetical predicted protein [Octopus vulgaris]|uniref:Uncharacterized protein n=1 Tax=Octopus vulgaris TaxID=6645 RepID=A0AA36F3F1_OCTVU|nr:Hypothetical predicted protein [Octopus vulgaris]